MPAATYIEADNLAVLRSMGDGTIDAVVTDPPGGISFMSRAWDSRGTRAAFVAFLTPRLAECLRVARPGARMLCWSIPRTSHWTGTAIEDAGWTIENTVVHLFGQGFPKGKGQLKPGHETWWLARKPGGPVPPLPGLDACRIAIDPDERTIIDSRSGSDDGIRDGIYHDGVGRRDAGERFKSHPSGRWPPNVALSHVGGPGGCVEVGTRRVKGSGKATGRAYRRESTEGYRFHDRVPHDHVDADGLETVPAWRCHPDCPVAALDAMSGTSRGREGKPRTSCAPGLGYGMTHTGAEHDDPGGASRFFYCAKASRSDKGEGNLHPTVKSTSLMRWLVRLVSRPGEVILDAFAGSATTLAAAILEGRDALGIEDDPESWPYGHGRLRRISPPRKSLCMHTGRIAAVYRADEEEGERPR